MPSNYDQNLDVIVQAMRKTRKMNRNRSQTKKRSFNNNNNNRRSNYGKNNYNDRSFSRFNNNNYRGGRRTFHNSRGPSMRRSYFNGSNGGIKLVTNPNITKMNVSNLDFGVTQNDMRELFSSVGQLKHVALHYDRNGRSQGTCEIIFESRQDALSAFKSYNGVPLDGRSMLLELMGEPTQMNFSQPRDNTKDARDNTEQNNRREKKEAVSDNKNKTAEDLDKELDAYLTEGASKSKK